MTNHTRRLALTLAAVTLSVTGCSGEHIPHLTHSPIPTHSRAASPSPSWVAATPSIHTPDSATHPRGASGSSHPPFRSAQVAQRTIAQFVITAMTPDTRYDRHPVDATSRALGSIDTNPEVADELAVDATSHLDRWWEDMGRHDGWVSVGISSITAKTPSSYTVAFTTTMHRDTESFTDPQQYRWKIDFRSPTDLTITHVTSITGGSSVHPLWRGEFPDVLFTTHDGHAPSPQEKTTARIALAFVRSRYTINNRTRKIDPVAGFDTKTFLGLATGAAAARANNHVKKITSDSTRTPVSQKVSTPIVNVDGGHAELLYTVSGHNAPTGEQSLWCTVSTTDHERPLVHGRPLVEDYRSSDPEF